MNEVKRKEIVTNTLIKAGASIADKGFYLLRDIILAYMNNENPVDVKQKDVYIQVGKKYGMSYATVQKCVRIPIDNAMSYSDVDFLQEYFGVCYRAETGTVKPQSFILRAVDDAKLQCEKIETGGTLK